MTADPTSYLGPRAPLILQIREGEPDSVALSTSGLRSCTELFENVPPDAFTEGPYDYIEVAGDGDIETG